MMETDDAKHIPIQRNADHAQQRERHIRVEYHREDLAQCLAHYPSLYFTAEKTTQKKIRNQIKTIEMCVV